MDVFLVAWRYLIARPITLVSVGSVMVGLMAIVVVDSVMNGFLAEQQARIRALAPDVSVEAPDSSPQELAALLARVRATDGVRAAGLRMELPAMHRPADEPPLAVGLPGVAGNYFVQLVGIDAEAERELIGLNRFLSHEPCAFDTSYPSLLPPDRSGHCPLRVDRIEDPFGFDPSSDVWRARLKPDYYRRDDLTPILFGERLALEFRYTPGTVLTVATLAQDPNEKGRHATRTRLFVVVGTFVTRDEPFDLTHALIPRARAADFAGDPSAPQELAVAGVAGLSESLLRDRLRATLAPLGVAPKSVETWADRSALLLQAVESERRVMNVAMFFVVVVATFSLFMTLHQMVRLKTRDLGVLAALGAPPMRQGRLFLTCGLFVTLAGALLGFFGGLALTHWLNDLLNAVERLTGLRLFNRQLFNIPELPTRIDLGRIGWYVFGTVLCGTLFTLWPSLRAARLDPVEALRHE